MGVTLQHSGITAVDTKRVQVSARMVKKTGSIVEELDYPIWVPTVLAPSILRNSIEVRTWFFNKALKHLVRNKDGAEYDFVYSGAVS